MVQGKEMSTPTIDTELRDLLVKYGALQFSVNPIAMQKLKALIESQKQALLDHLLSHGHGGGNWRRLIEQAKAEDQ